MGSPLTRFDAVPALPTQFFSLFFSLALLLTAGGCASGRIFQISADPPDATITIDGINAGKGPVVEQLSVAGGQTHTVMVARPGFSDRIVMLDANSEADVVHVELKPRTRALKFNVTPLPAIVKIDGRPIANDAVSQASAEIPFTVDAKNNWMTHVASAERPGYRRTEKVVHFTDSEATYTLAMEPERKDVTITTDPIGAAVTVDGKPAGTSPVQLNGFVIGTDPQTNEWIGRKIRAAKPGYEPAESVVSWDEGKTEYVLKLGVKSKVVQLKTDPADALVKLGDRLMPHGSGGAVALPLEFAPTDDQGKLPAFDVTISAADGGPSLTPAKLSIGWDDGKTDYSAKLSAAIPIVRTIPLIRPKWTHDAAGWHVEVESTPTVFSEQTAEAKGARVTRIMAAPDDGAIDELATSPDGSALAYGILSQKPEGLRSQLWVRPASGDGMPMALTDGKSLDLHPIFAPNGSDVLFSSSRDGKRFAAFLTSTNQVSPKAMASDRDVSLLNPSMDSAPQPRMYVESRPTDGAPSRLMLIELPDGKLVDLKQLGSQPRVSPRADSVVFTRADPKTGKRDLFLFRQGEQDAINLTNSPDDDDYDPAWSDDGGRIAFTSDRRETLATTRSTTDTRDLNIWVLDTTKPDHPRRVTDNPSRDDSPAWNGDGTELYFRSNRGGAWGIWKIELK